MIIICYFVHVDTLLQCRVHVKRISKNHIVNNLALSFLKSNPGEKI